MLGFDNILNNPYWVLIIEIFNGLSFSWINTSTVIFAYKLNKQYSHINNNYDDDYYYMNNNNINLSSFNQSVLSAMYNCIGQAIGSLIGGIIFNKYGAKYLFFGTALLILPCFIIIIIQNICCNNNNNKTKTKYNNNYNNMYDNDNCDIQPLLPDNSIDISQTNFFL